MLEVETGYSGDIARISTLTTGYDSNRDGQYYPYIIPDIVISKQDNFDKLMSDANIQEAVKFIKPEALKD